MDASYVAEWQQYADQICNKLSMNRVVIQMRGNMGKTLGRAHYKSHIVELKPTASDEQMIDTLLHELAHIMAFDLFGHTGHGDEWKHCCSITGANPNALHEVNTSEHAIELGMRVYRCEDGCEWRVHRRRTSWERGAYCKLHHKPVFLAN